MEKRILNAAGRGKRLNMEEMEASIVHPPESLRAFAEKHYVWMRERNYSEDTVHSRRGLLKKFFAWCDDRGIEKLTEITLPLMERYQKHLYRYRNEKTGLPLAFGTQGRTISNLREFFRWAVRRGYIVYNPAADLELPRPEQRLPKYILTAEEVEKILVSIDTNTPEGVRDRAIIETLYSTGMRRKELSGLNIFDIDADRGTVMVRRGKGKKDRLIPIGERATRWIAKYMLEVRPKFIRGDNSKAVFLSVNGNEINPDQISVIVKKIVESSGVEKKGACHLFRHTMASLLLENGADIRFIQAMLGHAKISTTEIYTQVSIKKLKEIHMAMHPAERPDTTEEESSH